MTVRELIVRLQAMPPDRLVYFQNIREYGWVPVHNVEEEEDRVELY